jgi:ATP-dependent helicase/nuclease subunit B
VLSDEERRRINEISSAGLVLAPDRPRENALALKACVARLSGDVDFVYSGFQLRDLANPGEVFPSPFLLEAFRLRPGEADADYARLATSLGEGEGFVPDAGRALDETEWWLASIGDRRGVDVAARVALVHPWLADGIRAEDARRSPVATPWDGVFSSPAPELDPRVNGRPMSASRIQALAHCPFGYFLAHVLKLSAPDEPEDDGIEWLDRKTSGSLIHRVFRVFVERAVAAERRPSHPEDLPALLAIADAELASMRRRVPPRSELAFSRQRDEVAFACRTFLIEESARPAGVEPVAFEVGFGLSGLNADDEEDAPRFPDPVEIPLAAGRKLLLRGSIDRVDRDGAGGYHVWDYKTGTAAFTYEEKGIAAGRQIQPALYGLAWEELAARSGEPGRVVESGYFFPGVRGLGKRFAIRYSTEETRRTLDVLFDLLAVGAFPHTPDEDSDCFVCRELSVFCRRDSARLARGKLRDATAPALAAWTRLRDE